MCYSLCVITSYHLTATIHDTVHFTFAATYSKELDKHTHISHFPFWNSGFGLTLQFYSQHLGTIKEEKTHLICDVLLLFIQQKQHNNPGKLAHLTYQALPVQLPLHFQYCNG